VSRRADRGDFIAQRGRCESDQRSNSLKATFSNHPLICDCSSNLPIWYHDPQFSGGHGGLLYNEPGTISLSAAQPQPKDRGEINALVPSWALCRAALKGATSSLKGGRCKSRISGRTIRRQRSQRIC